MAGTKRTRGSKAAAPAKRSSPSASSHVSKALNRLLQVATDPQRSTAALRAFADGKCWLEDAPPKKQQQSPHWDSYWVIVSTCLMNRLMKDPSQQASSGRSRRGAQPIVSCPSMKSRLLVLSAFCDGVSQILVADKSVLEKASHVATCRSILARSTLTTTVASAYCLKQAAALEELDGNPVSFQIWDRATKALERVTHLRPCSSDSEWKFEQLDEACEELATSSKSQTTEEACVGAILNMDSSSTEETTPPKRSTRGRRRNTSPAKGVASNPKEVMTALKSLQKLVDEAQANQKIDSRVAIKRWASVALAWIGDLQLHVLKAAHQLAQREVDDEMDLFTKLNRMKRIVDIVSEAGGNCGMRPPTIAMHQYVRAILPVGIRGSQNASSKVKASRTDIRDWATVVIYDLVQVHRSCLQSVSASIVNEGDSATDFSSSVQVEPMLRLTLWELGRKASSSAVGAKYSEQDNWSKVLQTYAAAQCLQLCMDATSPRSNDAQEPSVALDCQLAHTAISHLSDIVRQISLETSSRNRFDPEAALERSLSMNTALPIPSVSSLSTADNDNSTTFVPSVSFAGIWDGDKEFTNDIALSVILRALHDPYSGTGVTGRLVSVLTSIVEKAYDTSHPNNGQGQSSTFENVSPRTNPIDKKRKTRGIGRRPKRRKNEEGEPEDVCVHEYRRLTSTRALVATDALTALRLCLTVGQPGPYHLQSIRDALETGHVVKILELGNMLNEVLIKTRTRCDWRSIGDSVSTSFNHFEKPLWSEHMNLCRVLGRGTSNYNGTTREIFDNEDRLLIYQSFGISWPLSLPAAHLSFLIANLTSENGVGEKYKADIFLVKAFTKSIEAYMGQIHSIKDPNCEEHLVNIEDGIQLSYNDARTFILAASRLPSKEKNVCFEQLVEVVSKGLNAIQANDSKRRHVAEHSEASGFISRVLVVCCSFLDVVSASGAYRDTLFSQAGQSQVKLPGSYTRSTWYRRDRCFMSVLDDWGSPAVPALPSVPTVPRKSKAKTQLIALLENSFDLGFETAKKDKCHLLFAAWKGIGKILEQDPGTAKSSMPTSGISSSRSILEMRENVYRFASGGRQTHRLKLMLYKAKQLLETTLQTNLPEDDEMRQDLPLPAICLLTALPAYISSAISGHSKAGNDYMSNLLKSVPNGNKRESGYSSDSENLPSDTDSLGTDRARYRGVSTAPFDALARLKGFCDSFGAAPVHPDWLDVSCSLQDGISHDDAVSAAELAIATLSKLISVAFVQYNRSIHAYLKMGCQPADNLDSRIALCMNFLQCKWHESVGDLGEDQDASEWLETLASFSGLRSEDLDLISDKSLLETVGQAKEAWCRGAPQQLSNGYLLCGDTSPAELRALGDWEALLTGALTSACLALPNTKEYGDSTSSHVSTKIVDEKPDAAKNSALLEAQSWKLVLCSAVSSLMPAAALLRLGVARVGRKPHPFSFHLENPDPEQETSLSFSERLPDRELDSLASKDLVVETLSMLSKLCVVGDQTFCSMCYAVASHLAFETKSFVDLEALQNLHLSFAAIKSMRELVETPHDTNSFEQGSESFLLRRVLPVASTKRDDFRIILSALGITGMSTVDTVSRDRIDICDILRAWRLPQKSHDFWESSSRGGDIEKAIGNLLWLVHNDNLNADDSTRSHAIHLINGIVVAENRFRVPSGKDALATKALISSFNSVDEDGLRSIIYRDLLCINPITSEPRCMKAAHASRAELASIFICLLSQENESSFFEGSKFCLSVLLNSFEAWGGLDAASREPLLEVSLVYGCRFRMLGEIGDRLLAQASSQEASPDGPSCAGNIELLSMFFTYLRDMYVALCKPKKDDTQSQKDQSAPDKKGAKTSISPPPASATDQDRSCSFVLKRGFHGQHWYNCYTCGLVWDKGCCTLCALVCHRGHDVSYSRYSSFFCDCGAEDGNSNEQNRVSCKCLNPLSHEQIEEAFAMQVQPKPHPSEKNKPEEVALPRTRGRTGIEVAHRSFRDTAIGSIDVFKDSSKGSTWLSCLFAIVQAEFESWKASKIAQRVDNATPFLSSTQKPKLVLRVPHTVLRQQLRERCAKPLELSPSTSKPLLPFQAVTGFSVGTSGESSRHTNALSRLGRQGVSKSCLSVDSRGRMVLAQVGSLLFASPISDMRKRDGKGFGTPLTPQQLIILGSSSVTFTVVGMRLCPSNERHLLIWGSSEACVVVVNPCWDGVEETFDLSSSVDGRETESDCLVKCEWIEGSQTSIAAGCSRVVRVYDVSRANKEKRCHPLIEYNLGVETSLRDLCLVDSKRSCMNEETSDQAQTHSKKMFLLLENGRMHAVDLTLRPDGTLEPKHDHRLEPSQCTSFSIAGVRPSAGSSIGHLGEKLRTFGEGASLTVLRQSRILLYQCTSSCVLAAMLDEAGGVDSTFELLPPLVSGELLGNNSRGSVSGPYSQWAELGVVRYGGAAYFRSICIGRSTHSRQKRILCVDFNEKDVRVSELDWLSHAAGGAGVGLTPGTSFEGLAAFSAPVITETFTKEQVAGERTFLMALTSSGTLLLFGETEIDALQLHKSGGDTLATRINLDRQRGLISNQPEFPLTVFEKLINVSDSDEVVFKGEETGSDPGQLKSRLARDNSTAMICPRKEGCTLTVSLKSRSNRTEKNKKTGLRLQLSSKECNYENSVIAALRFLVGSTSNYIPSRIYVQGRAIELRPRVKKWYSVPLTDAEIATSLRNGFVSIRIGESFDPGNSVVVDSIEVYAASRETVDEWLPKVYLHDPSRSLLSPTAEPEEGLADEISPSNDKTDILVSSARALTCFCELLGPNRKLSEVEQSFLREFIQETAFDRDNSVAESVEVLLEHLEPNSRARRSFHDESILLGCSSLLQESASEASGENGTVRFMLKDCLSAACAIARERPMNYLQSMEKIFENHGACSSIAVESSKIILDGFANNSTWYDDLIAGSGGVIDLVLTEMAIELNTEAPHSSLFAKFDTLRGFLESKNPTVIERTCEAISSFCKNHGKAEGSPTDSPDVLTLLQHARLVAYQCDSCSLFPMKETRYTLLEEGHDIDLCKKCFRAGYSFAESNGFSTSTPVIIDGKPVGSETALTCAQIRQMQPVSLEKMDVEQGEVQPTTDAQDADKDLQLALRMSLGETTPMTDKPAERTIGSQAYEDFLQSVFSSLTEFLARMMRNDRYGPTTGPLVRLLLDMMRHSKMESSKIERAKRLGKELTNGLSYCLKRISSSEELSQEITAFVVTCLRALSCLVLPESDSHYYVCGSQPDEVSEDPPIRASKDKTNPNFVCDIHGLPAVRRRCARGTHKGRRFYVCGKDRGQRCKYFVWADQQETSVPERRKVEQKVQEIIKAYLWNMPLWSGLPLHARLCRLLENQIFLDEGRGDTPGLLSSSLIQSKNDHPQLKSLYSSTDIEKDFMDGVFCSRERLQDVVVSDLQPFAHVDTCDISVLSISKHGERGAVLLEAALDLMTLLADHSSAGISRWFSLLCEINMSTRKPASMRSAAKQVLKTLCLGRRPLYQSVRDHFAFWFQLKILYGLCSAPLEAALMVAEKARVCSDEWSSGSEVSWTGLSAGDLVGTEHLILEDHFSQEQSKNLEKVLNEMWSIVKNRGRSWREFCGLGSLPVSERENHSSGSSAESGVERALCSRAPIVALVWIASSIGGSNQVKLLRLIGFALTDWKERKQGQKAKAHSSSDDELCQNDSCESSALSFRDEGTLPENILLHGPKSLAGRGLVVFALHFLSSGRSVDSRRCAYHITAKLCSELGQEAKSFVFENLVSSAFGRVGRMGKASLEFLNLLQALAKDIEPSPKVWDAADLVMESCVEQINCVKFGQSNGDWAVVETTSGLSNTKRKYDFSECVFCLKASVESTHKAAEKRNDAGSTRNTASRTSRSTSAQRLPQHRRWHQEQVAPYTRERLEVVKLGAASNEFCAFYTLKHRLIMSEIHLTVSDPRGRFVKAINVYVLPRPVADVQQLKRTEIKWQKCASMKLSRGASRASAVISSPVAASNIKIEYAAFYERPGGSKASDGTLLVHCPRCTRVVTNAHGVCGHCGEVAFQCRKCRHINYDRLDAFLCVECGYCASGSFSLEISAGVASNAIAISNDQDQERTTKILGATTSVHDDLQTVLREKLAGLEAAKNSSSKHPQTFGSILNPAIERAFAGLPPLEASSKRNPESILDRVEKPGSVVKLVARPESSSQSLARSSVAADRTRSLLRLARQIRSESGSSSDRRRSSDVIIRHLGRGLTIDSLDDENDLIGLLEGSAVLDRSESLSRAITQLQSRRSGDSNREDVGASRRGTRTGASGGSKETSSRGTEAGKEIVEECQRLHVLMREAQKEKLELGLRLNSWDCLNEGSIVRTGTTPLEEVTFEPSHCSVCGTAVALQLLVLWLRLFTSSPSDIHVDKDFLALLWEDTPNNKMLSDCKRQVVREIATRSKEGAKLVLEELRKRLKTSHDGISAEILGGILQVEGFFLAEEYSKLAMEVLDANR